MFLRRQFLDHQVMLLVEEKERDGDTLFVVDTMRGQFPLELTTQQFQQLLAIGEMWFHPKF